MIISHKYKFIFFCPVGNCGTTSIQRSLLPHHDEPRIKNKYEENFADALNDKNPFGTPLHYEGFVGDKENLIVNKHITPKAFFTQASQLRNFKTDIIKKYLKFAVRRNPWDWALAVFAKNFIKLEDWTHQRSFGRAAVKEVMSLGGIQSQYEAHCDTDGGESLIDTFLPFENLNESFLSLMKELQVEGIDVFHEQNNKNVGQKKYRPYYTDEGREAIFHAFKTDIDMFHYEF
jgi:hypothetical protein